MHCSLQYPHLSPAAGSTYLFQTRKHPNRQTRSRKNWHTAVGSLKMPVRGDSKISIRKRLPCWLPSPSTWCRWARTDTGIGEYRSATRLWDNMRLPWRCSEEYFLLLGRRHVVWERFLPKFRRKVLPSIFKVERYATWAAGRICFLLAWLTLRPWKWRRWYVSLKRP
jgi:hypothetical protein